MFKCASDTVFLDDFKSVLDDIIARKLSSAGGGTIHNNIYYGQDNTRKRRRFSTRGDPALIESARLPIPGAGPVTTVKRPHRSAKRSRLVNPFHSREQKEIVPEIHVQRETMVTSEVRKRSHDSWYSDQELLRAPEAAANRGVGHDDSPMIASSRNGEVLTFTQNGYQLKLRQH